jgi:hypothetical protein
LLIVLYVLTYRISVKKLWVAIEAQAVAAEKARISVEKARQDAADAILLADVSS